MTTIQIIEYYKSLLILQYLGKPKAAATIEALVTPIIMDQMPLAVQNAFVIGNTEIAGTFYVGAVGVQLDILGKYAGVTRTGVDLSGNPITLNDVDFTTLIKLAVINNGSGSSLADIQKLIHAYFANEIFVFDGADMQMSYLIAASVGSQSLIELFITEGVLPKPMGVQLSAIVYIPTISLFGFQRYASAAPNYDPAKTYGVGGRAFSGGTVYSSLTDGNQGNPVTDTVNWVAIIYPYNTYKTYPLAKPYTWLTYADGINVL